jgi:putative glutamine amidotransferase
MRAKVNHEAGKKVAVAHTVEIEPGSKLAGIVAADGGGPIVVPVNSSHHQSAEVVGDGLRIVGRCREDGIIEALEGTAVDHFVLAVQWHPERSVNDGPELAESAKAIFRAFMEAARAKRAELASELERHLT